MVGNLLLAAVLCSFTVKTSLYDLIGDDTRVVSEATKNETKDTLVIIASSDSAAKSQQSAKKFADSILSILMGTDPDRVGTDPAGLGGMVPVGRVCAEDSELLKSAEGRAKIAKRALRRYIASPMPPIFKPEEDPFCLKERFVMSLGTSTNAIVPVKISADISSNLDRLIEFSAEVNRRLAAANAEDASVKIMVTGVPMHTAATAGRCRREIGYLTWFSLAFIALLSIVVFRSIKWIPLLLASLGVSAAAGAAAVFLGFDSVHLMTLVFGTTVMGLVIDYSFHWLLAPHPMGTDPEAVGTDPEAMRTGPEAMGTDPVTEGCDCRRETVKSLLLSWITTEIGLFPLMISSLPVLRQTAVFLAVALTAALVFVIFCYPKRRLGTSARRTIMISALLTVVIFVGCDRVGTDPAAIYRPPAELAEADRLMPEIWGQTPTDMAEIAKLYAEHADKQFAALGIDRVGTDPERAGNGVGTDPAGARERLEAALKELTDESVRRLGMALGLMFAVLVVFLRRRAVRTMVPSLIAIAAVGGFVLLTEGKINLFHLLAMFLLAGMSVDYTIFIHGAEGVEKVKVEGQERWVGSGYRSALCSLLTSMAGFGALYFVSFPVVSAFGAVLGFGLPIGFLAAIATRKRGLKGCRVEGLKGCKVEGLKGCRVEGLKGWKVEALKGCKVEGLKGESGEDVEKAASPIGMEIIWWSYRILGRGVMRVLCALVADVVWMSSAKVRRASPRRRKLVEFAWSMADKLVVMAEGRSLPRVETDGSPDAAAFVAEVSARKGVFVLSSHVGTVEVLSALAENPPRFHAWMDVGRTSVFNAFYLRHAKTRKTEIHPVSEIGMETAFAAGEWLDAGECLVMAGDRGDGAFRFARAMGHPVYFAACVAERGGYRAVIRRLPAELADMKAEYFRIRDGLAAERPDQVFEWENVE